MTTFPYQLQLGVQSLRESFGDEACRAAFASFEATFLDPMPTITPDPPELDAAELRRWAVEQAVKMAAASMRDGRGSLVVADVADKFIAYVIGKQTP